MSDPAVAAVIVQHGAPEPALECLDALVASRGVELRLAVVDHNDTASEALRRATLAHGGLPVNDPANPGYGAGVERGFALLETRSPGAELFVALNPDVRLEAGCLAALAGVARRDPRIGALGPGLLDAADPRRWWNLGSSIEWPRCRPGSWSRGEEAASWAGGEAPLDVDFVAGAALALTASSRRILGAFPGEYFLYFEDAEVCYRLRRHGLRCVVVPGARAVHAGGGSTASLGAELAYYTTRNRLEFSRRWCPGRLRGRWARFRFGAGRTLRSLGRYLVSRDPLALLPARGVVDYLGGKLGRRLPSGLPPEGQVST